MGSELFNLIKSQGTRAAVTQVLGDDLGIASDTVTVVAELLALLESKRLVKRGNIIDYLERVTSSIKDT